MPRQRPWTELISTGLTISRSGEVVELADSAAALLLTPVGEPLPQPTTKDEVTNVFQFLWKLHMNQPDPWRSTHTKCDPYWKRASLD